MFNYDGPDFRCIQMLDAGIVAKRLRSGQKNGFYVRDRLHEQLEELGDRRQLDIIGSWEELFFAWRLWTNGECILHAAMKVGVKAFTGVAYRLLGQGHDPNAGLACLIYNTLCCAIEPYENFCTDLPELVLLLKCSGASTVKNIELVPYDDFDEQYHETIRLEQLKRTPIIMKAMTEDFRSLIRERCAHFKEDLMKVVFHPERVDRMGGYDWLEAVDP